MPTIWGDVSNLNARYDQLPVSGLGAGSIGGNALGVLGLGATACEDRAKAAATKDCTEYFDPNEASGLPACIAERTAEYIRRDCGTGGGGAPPPATKCPAGQQLIAGKCEVMELPKKRSKIGGDVWWIVGGVVVAGAAVGTALWMRKKKRG